MPRGSKKNANQHNSRHENGVVAPGKRIVKQRSNSNLNGSPDSRPTTTTTTSSSPLPTTTISPSQTLNSTSLSNSKNRPNGTISPGNASSYASRPLQLGRGHKDEQSGEDGTAQQENGGSDSNVTMGNELHSKRLEHTSIGRSYGVASSLPVPLTVLLSCPLRDALAILILLLCLPPVLVTVTNSLFAVMTFVPPSGSFTLVPTLTDITSSFSPGTPSFLVTCLIDVLAMTLWIWIPFPSLQAFFLDAAQAMVATTLGGGYSYRPGSKDNTLYCVFIVVATHITRYRAIFLKPIRHRLEKWGPWIGEFDENYIQKYPVGFERNWLATIKVFIALHIFCQGVTGMVRWRLHTHRQPVAPSRTTDTESSHAYTTGAEVPSNPPHSPTELRPRQSFPNLREVNRDKISSGKRRRKQANYVRSQQPFWAAIAATKTNIMREYETKRATADATHAQALGPDELGDAPFLDAENTVFVTEVKETALFFETGPFPAPRSSRHGDDSGDESSKEEGVDRSRPLYVRCNKTDWVSMRLVPIPDSGLDHRPRWVGEVYGLSAGKTYSISFVRSDDDEVISTQTIATPAATLDVAATTPSSTTFSPRPSSPASPTATLKSSIADSEARLGDLESQQRRARKENKGALANLHREIEVFNERLHNNSNNDSKLQDRLSQLTQHKRQVDDAVEAINSELDEFESLPPEEMKEWKTRKAALEAARKKQTQAHNELANVRKSNKQALDARKSEELNISHKIVRLQGRLKRVTEQHDKLNSASEDNTPAAKLEEHGRSNSDASGKDATQAARAKPDLARYAMEIDALSRELQSRTMQNNTLLAQVDMLKQSRRMAEEIMASNGSDDPSPWRSYYGASPLSAQHDVEISRPGTPDESASMITGPTSIGTGFGPSRIDQSSTPDTMFSGLPGAFPPPEANGNGNVPSPLFLHQTSPPTYLHESRLHAEGSRLRSMSGLSGGSDSLQFFNPDDDDLVPDKIKQHRRSGFGTASFGSARDGGASEGSGSSGGASPAVKFRGMGMRNSPSPRT